MVKKGASRVRDRAEDSSAIYTVFFPLGLTELNETTVAEGQTVASRLKISANNHAALLGADFKTKVDVLVDGYMAARAAQVAKKGSSSDTRGSRDESKQVLQDQLFENLLFFASR